MLCAAACSYRSQWLTLSRKLGNAVALRLRTRTALLEVANSRSLAVHQTIEGETLRRNRDRNRRVVGQTVVGSSQQRHDGSSCQPSLTNATGVVKPRSRPGHAARSSTARTVDGHHWAPPCAVGVPLALRSQAIWRRLLPPACSAWMCCTTPTGIAAGLPGGTVWARPRAGRRPSFTNRSSSSTGTSRVPHGSSTVSSSGSTRRSKVERLTPSASAAWVRV